MGIYSWNPQKVTLDAILDCSDRVVAFKKYRNSSSGYIQKKAVREHILMKNGRKCTLCFSTMNLQIDHIKSVYYCFKKEKYWDCNCIENLTVLCGKCNASKAPI